MNASLSPPLSVPARCHHTPRPEPGVMQRCVPSRVAAAAAQTVRPTLTLGAWEGFLHSFSGRTGAGEDTHRGEGGGGKEAACLSELGWSEARTPMRLRGADLRILDGRMEEKDEWKINQQPQKRLDLVISISLKYQVCG